MSNARFCGTNKKSHLKGCGRMRQRLSRQIIFIYLFIFIFFSSVEAMQKSVSAQALLSSVGMTKSGFDKAHSIVVRAQPTKKARPLQAQDIEESQKWFGLIFLCRAYGNTSRFSHARQIPIARLTRAQCKGTVQ